jgi:2-polyprenyl-3-methyl-5-hydroxy-6-metoxy-1,4-benzoquinol methylase
MLSVERCGGILLVENVFGWTGAGVCAHHGDILEPVISQLQKYGASRILDLGSGNGSLTRALSSAGFDVLGIEPDQQGAALAREAGGEFIEMSVYDEPSNLGEFDAIICAEVIEHLFEPAAVPRFAGKLLRPGQPLIITTPFHGYFKNLMIAATGGWDAHLEPLHDGGHIKFFSQPTLSRLLNEHGFSSVHFEGAGRIAPIWRSMIMTAEKTA